MAVLATTPWLPIVLLIAIAPTMVVLFVGAFYLAKNERQQAVYLISAFLVSSAAIVAVVLLYHPIPNSWGDRYFGLIVLSAAPIGAGVGLTIGMGLFRCFERLWFEPDHEK